MRRNLFVLVGLTLAALVVAGCAQSTPKTPVAPATKTPKPTFTATANAPAAPLAMPAATKPPATPTAAATATAVPSPTSVPATPTPAAPKITANQNVNVRGGPGANYAKIGELTAGQSFDIVGKNSAGDWYQFSFNGQQGWVRQDFVTLNGDAGVVQIAQNIPAPPPTARPAPPPQPPAPPAPPPPAAPPAPRYAWGQYVQGSAIAAPQCGTPYFQGQAQYQSGGAQNGACIVVDYYGPRQLKYSGSGGAGDGNWGFSPCGQGDCKGDIYLYVVECPPNVPDGGLALGGNGGSLKVVSDKFKATITDKCVTGQWTNIIFKSYQ